MNNGISDTQQDTKHCYKLSDVDHINIHMASLG